MQNILVIQSTSSISQSSSRLGRFCNGSSSLSQWAGRERLSPREMWTSKKASSRSIARWSSCKVGPSHPLRNKQIFMESHRAIHHYACLREKSFTFVLLYNVRRHGAQNEQLKFATDRVEHDSCPEVGSVYVCCIPESNSVLLCRPHVSLTFFALKEWNQLVLKSWTRESAVNLSQNGL